MSTTDSDIWVPSDSLLARDPIALAKVHHPHDSIDENSLPSLGEVVDDDANAEAAACVLAEAKGDELGEVELGPEDTDDEVEDANLPSNVLEGV